jgi:hypothetical protein
MQHDATRCNTMPPQSKHLGSVLWKGWAGALTTGQAICFHCIGLCSSILATSTTLRIMHNKAQKCTKKPSWTAPQALSFQPSAFSPASAPPPIFPFTASGNLTADRRSPDLEILRPAEIFRFSVRPIRIHQPIPVPRIAAAGAPEPTTMPTHSGYSDS